MFLNSFSDGCFSIGKNKTIIDKCKIKNRQMIGNSGNFTYLCRD